MSRTLFAAMCLLTLLVAAAIVGTLLGAAAWTAVLVLYVIAVPAATIALNSRRDRP